MMIKRSDVTYSLLIGFILPIEAFPADTRRWINVGLALVHRLRRWTNAKPTLIQRLESAGIITAYFFAEVMVVFIPWYTTSEHATAIRMVLRAFIYLCYKVIDMSIRLTIWNSVYEFLWLYCVSIATFVSVACCYLLNRLIEYWIVETGFMIEFSYNCVHT